MAQSIFYIGPLRPVGTPPFDPADSGSEDDAATPIVSGIIVPRLVPCELLRDGTESERPLSLTALLSSASSTSVASCSAGPQSQPSPSSLALEGGGDRSFLEVCGPASRLLALGVPASELDAEQTRPDTHEEEAHASSGALSTWTAMASGSGALDLLSASHSGGKRNKAKGFDRSQHLGTYYVCTACGWSGSTRPRHDQRATVKCKFTPNRILYKAGEDRKKKVQDYMARVTPTQREHGLPPDGELVAISATGDRIYLTVPEGLSAGDTFSAPVAAKETMMVTVPEGATSGQVIEVSRGEQPQVA